MDFIVRSHSDSIIMMDYHRMAKCLITISKDFTIKIWKLNTGHIVQAYEFRCIDEQVLSLRCFNNSPNFICGFESGALRVFNIDQSAVICELDPHKLQVNDIQISLDDKYVATSDNQGTIQIFDQNLEFNRSIESIHFLLKSAP